MKTRLKLNLNKNLQREAYTGMRVLALLALAFSIAIAHPAESEESVTQQDVQVIVNTMKYVIGIPGAGKPLRIAALYDPSNPASKTEADAFVREIGNSKIAKQKQFSASISTIAEASDVNTDLLFVPSGFAANYAKVGELAKGKHLFPVTTDQACVAAKACVFSFSVGDTIEIYLSEDALKTYGFDVDAAFRLMARPI